MRNVLPKYLPLAVTCATLALLTGGCSQGTIENIPTEAEFDRRVVDTAGPVLVDFYKDSCPTCVIQEGVLENLAKDYGDQVKFVRFKIREVTMAGAAPEIMKRYDLFWVPTVILFVDGQEKERWTLNHPAEAFRPALDKVTARTAGETSAAPPQ